MLTCPGFRNLNQAQLLSDQLYYPDSLDAQQWLVYYISRPLFGSYEPIEITPATVANALSSWRDREDAEKESAKGSSSQKSDKRDVKSFNDLLNHFPMIARQMQGGLEKVFKQFNKDMNDWAPSGQSPRSSIASQTSSSSTNRKSNGSISGKYSNGHPKSSASLTSFRVNEEENHMRQTLESAVTSAIDLFQKVDKQQLSFLGATTELTGPVVERLIERYVAEQLHDSFLFPRLCNSKKVEDCELESKVHGMQNIDVAQVGITIEDGRRGKDRLVSNITKAAEEFRKLGVAGSPQQMLEILLTAQKLVTGQQSSLDKASAESVDAEDEDLEKPPVQTMNADTLVSLLLVVVIRSHVRNLYARLTYMRNFIFIEDVEAGETGYALSTLEAVLSYLSTDSAGLRKASQRNKRLWQATRSGDIATMKSIFEASGTVENHIAKSTVQMDESDGDQASDDEVGPRASNEHVKHQTWTSTSSGQQTPIEDGFVSEGSTLAHVFPFKAAAERKKGKRVSMDLQSISNASEYSFISRTTTLDSILSTVEGDTSIETLAQTQNSDGSSVVMMAVEAQQRAALEYLLALEDLYPLKMMLEDSNKAGTTLLSAAIQTDPQEMIQLLLDRIFETSDDTEIRRYLCHPDSRGRTAAHYLFNAPWLLLEIGGVIPWTQKDKIGQTPLLALCRSYDHPDYVEMVDAALSWARLYQGDGQPLHLDDHTDLKGNTLLHVVNHPSLAVRLLRTCDADPNAANDRRFTPLMVGSKFARLDMVRAFFGDPRVDVLAKEARGMTAVELAKDDEIRNRIDDMVLVSNVPAPDGRVTAVVRSFFVEDGSVRMIIKSATRNPDGMIGVTTCRRSLSDFENLARWLASEHPASWLPSIFNFRSPFQIPSRPARAVLRDIQVRLDEFLRIMLAHSTFSGHELLWEFILFPEIQPDMMAERSRMKAELRSENIHEEYEPVEDVQDVSSFADHARDSIRSVHHSTKSVARRATSFRIGLSSELLSYFLPSRLSVLTFMSLPDQALSASLLAKSLSTCPFLSSPYSNAMQRYASILQPYASDPHKAFLQSMLSIATTTLAMLSSLARPHALIANVVSIQKSIDRHNSSLRRSDRWPLGLLDDTRKAVHAEAGEKAVKSRRELEDVGCELAYTQQTVAAELAGWWELHAAMGRRAIRAYAKGMVVREKDRLQGMRRALRGIQLAQRQEGRGDGRR